MEYFVYCLCADDCSVVYVGSTINLADRLRSHAYHNKVFSKVFYIKCESEDQMLLLEKQFISKYKPAYNKILYSVKPFDGEILWTEFNDTDIINYLQYRSASYLDRVCPTLERASSAILFYCVDKNILKLRYLLSKSCSVNGIPQRLEFTSSDKLIYTYIKTRFEFCNQLGVDYMETQVEIASAVGVDAKTVGRFMKKMKTHGFIDYSTTTGSKVVYKFILDLV